MRPRRTYETPTGRLALGIDHLEGERARSFIERLAAENSYAPGALFGLLGDAVEERRRAYAGHQPTRCAFTALRRLTGQPRQMLDPLFAYPVGSSPVAVPRWRALLAPRHCPECLRADGGWRHAWTSNFDFACATHDLLLSGGCVTCGKPSGAPPRGIRADHPSIYCLHCHEPLVPATRASARLPPSLIDVQRQRDRWWRLAPSERDVRQHDTSILSRAALLNIEDADKLAGPLAHEAFRTWRQRGQHTAGAHRGLGGPAVYAAVAVTVQRIQDGDPNAVLSIAGRNLASLHDLRKSARTAEVRQTIDRALGGRFRGRSPTSRVGALALDPDVIPQQLPRTFFTEQLRDIAAQSEAITRRVVPVLILARASGQSYTDAANKLDYGELVTGDKVSAYMCLTRAIDAREVLDQRIASLGKALNDAGRPYGAYRRFMMRFEGIEDRAWRDACSAAGQRAGKRGSKMRMATAYLWSSVTGGDPWRSPALKRATYSERGVFRDFEQLHAPPLSPTLTRWTTQLQTLAEIMATAPSAAEKSF